MTHNACPICDSEKIHKQHRLYDDRYGYDLEFTLYICNICRHHFISHDFNYSDIGKLYTKYYPRSVFNIDQVKPLSEYSNPGSWFAGVKSSINYWVPRDVKVLDIGCGMGEALLYHRNRGCDVAGTEADKNVIAVAKEYNLDIRIGQFNKNDFAPSSFDYVTMDQVVEHLINPETTMSDIAAVLKDDGYLIVSTPNADGWDAKIFCNKWINGHIFYHLHFFSYYSMQILAERAGFSIEKYQQVTASDWLYYQFMHLISFPKMGEKSIFWMNEPFTRHYQKSFRRCCNLLRTIGFFGVITRIFDSLGIGDNQLFILKKICTE